METLNHILRYARDVAGLLLDNPAEKIRSRKANTTAIQIPTKEQFCTLLEALRSEPQAVRSGAVDFTEFLAYSGLRVAEGTSVTPRDVNFDKVTLTVTGGETGTKNHEARVVPLFPPFLKLLERLLAERKHQPRDQPIFNLKTIRRALQSACERAELPRFGHHSLRHFFCSNAIEAGVDFKTIAEWLGHKDGGVLAAKTYGHLRAEHSHAMALRITFEAPTPEPAPAPA